MSKEDNNLEKTRHSGKARTLARDFITRFALRNNAEALEAIVADLYKDATDPNLTSSERTAAKKVIFERLDGRPPESVEITDGGAELSSATVFKIVKVEPLKDE